MTEVLSMFIKDREKKIDHVAKVGAYPTVGLSREVAYETLKGLKELEGVTRFYFENIYQENWSKPSKRGDKVIYPSLEVRISKFSVLDCH